MTRGVDGGKHQPQRPSSFKPKPARSGGPIIPRPVEIGGRNVAGLAALVDKVDPATLVGLLVHLQRQVGNGEVRRLITSDPARLPVQRKDIYHETRGVLTWKDFKGKVPAGAIFDAETFSGIDPQGLVRKYKVSKAGSDWEVDGEVDVTKLNLKAFMRQGKSWVRKAKKSADLLRHEQGHFDIANVISEKAEPKVKARAAGAKAHRAGPKKKQVIKDAMDDLLRTPPFVTLKSAQTVLDGAQNDYDNDPVKGTNHGTKAAQQTTWEADIVGNLPAYPIP
ncbi:MAG TPA: hypothetical protein VII47_13580 [Actinomycetota bacterium]|jgi:hypothetical protein